MDGRLFVFVVVVAVSLAGSASAQSPRDMTEDECRRIYLVETNPPDWNAFDECRRSAVQIRPERPEPVEPRMPSEPNFREPMAERRPDGRG